MIHVTSESSYESYSESSCKQVYYELQVFDDC